MPKTAPTSPWLIIVTFVAVIMYAALDTYAGDALAQCRASANADADCSRLLIYSVVAAVGTLASVAGFSVVLTKRSHHSQEPLESVFYNADTGMLTLVFSKPVTLSDQWNMTLVDNIRAYLKIGIGNNIERGRASTVRGEINSRILELAAPPNVRDQILATVQNNRNVHIILAIPPNTIHFTSPLLDITTLNGGRTLHADIDIMRMT